jgi:hypothetical protein
VARDGLTHVCATVCVGLAGLLCGSMALQVIAPEEYRRSCKVSLGLGASTITTSFQPHCSSLQVIRPAYIQGVGN